MTHGEGAHFLPHRSHTLEKEDEERPTMLTISFVHHSLYDDWKHTPIQVKVQLTKGGKNGQTQTHGRQVVN